MPSERWRKKVFINKSTGTVPKTTYGNNSTNEQNNPIELQHHHLSNNLDINWHRQHFPSSSRNTTRNPYEVNPYSMDMSMLQGCRPNDLAHINMPGRTNGAFSTSSSSISNSGIDSLRTIPKCDNIKKYPDKKQIDDQLNQIREYLRVTTSLMSSIKNEDQHAEKDRDQFEKMVRDLKNSEAKLEALAADPFYDHCSENELEQVENGTESISECNGASYQRNGLEQKVEFTNRKVQLLREQQNALMNLKRKAENQLTEVRHLAEENQMLNQQQETCSNQLRSSKLDQSRVYSDTRSQANVKNFNESTLDPAIKDLEDRIAEMKKESLKHMCVNNQDKENGDEQAYLHDRLESTNDLLNMLENRDGQFTNEHIQLQQKFNELQIEKARIEQLTHQLQNIGDDEDEDIGNQVRKIVTMKQHLSSLKDLLEVVKNTEMSLLNTQNVNELEPDFHENAHSTSTTTTTKNDNIRQDVRTNHNQNTGPNSIRTNQQWSNEKDSNKTLIGIQEREKVLAELRAKKRELEEIMYKQKDRASINNDVCSEISLNKSESSTNNNMFDGSVMSWLPVHPHHNNPIPSYSSDDCPEEDVNEYSDLNSIISVTLGNMGDSQLPGPLLNSTVNMTKPRSQHGSVLPDFVQQTSPRIPERQTSAMSSASGYEHERPANNNGGVDRNKIQVQKQLELIQQVCQSLLDQQSSGNIQQLRNNLTPSPLYAEARSIPTNQQVSPMSYINQPIEVPYINGPPVNPQYFALNDVTNSQNMLAANTLQTQAFLLNTLNQCCQMLWFQQRELTSLRSMISSIQDQMINRRIDQEISDIPLVDPYIFPSPPNVYRSPSQPHNTPKVNQVSSACSMPNLNPPSPHANIENTFLNHNNVRSSPTARLLDSSLNNLSNQNLIGEHPANNTVLPSVNVANLNNTLPTQIWNGQALNNQVAPGNRANNYWDNFRSYSRQNLLSTSSKSNETLQNPTLVAIERLNTIYDRSQPILLPPSTPPKSNTAHPDSINLYDDTTTRRHLQLKTSHNTTSNKSSPAIPPDVLNINHSVPQQEAAENIELVNDSLLDLNNTTSENQNAKEQHATDRGANLNEWRNNEQSNTPKSKLFEELQGNVYKEVANLISANENRPHFLIQLFRDLQHINSDSMRGRTLQSIQTVLTHSIFPETKRSINRQSSYTNTSSKTEDHEVVDIHLQSLPSKSPLWQPSKSILKENPNTTMEKEDPNVTNILKPIVAFLNTHKDEVFYPDLIESFRNLLIKSVPFTDIFTSRNIQEHTFLKHFRIIFDESLEKYKGKRISEIYKDVLKTVTDILVGELSFIYLIQENIPESNCEISANSNPPVHENMRLHLQHHTNLIEDAHTPQMQNGDLAEADQSRVEVHQQEEEGAVGGILNGFVDVLSSSANAEQVGPDVTDLPKIDFTLNTESEVEFMEQGLDQVPTRLTIGSTSHSNTPIRDRSSSHSDTLEHF